LRPSPESSLESLITLGSDNRIIAGDDGLNRYGSSPLARDVIPFGSCTCSSPSSRGVKQARAVLDRIQQAESPEHEAEEVCREQRARLQQLLGLPSDIDVAFTPSGTDVELLALALVMMRCQRPIVNIVVGPTEVGSGTPLAAAGCHYDTITPCGDRVTQGQPACSRMASQVSVRNIEIRDDHGNMLDESLIDAMVVEVVSEAVKEGAHALLHVVAHSKTGMHAPSLDCTGRIVRHLGSDVSVVIDAAQGRVSRRGLREVLAAGHLVILTGSKFYGGPPFSGALLVPSSLRSTLHEPDLYLPKETWSQGLARYLTPADLPESWSTVRNWLPAWTNYGSILRWSAALAELEAYYAVDDEARLAVLRAFERDVPALFGDSPSICLMPVFPLVQDDTETRLLESKTTVFAFRVEINERMLGRTELAELHSQLNRGICDCGNSSSDDAMTTVFHLGQPVSFRDGSAALRIALGGEMIVRIATDETIGKTLDDRLGWLHSQLKLLRSKLGTLIAAKADTANV
jgi:hypothetical protein